ncbi:hypothetical protein Q6348_00830 [Isoptericola sp. b441]|uniref:Carboxypeptidase regulatory-like domain-containing protein n=1 Tax=Actinotalea lenta TaxID=3064654 RepID=A0ABT9D4V1_9CELL|nr:MULTISPECIES: hypothetical protein [unclassified Isoptericola]MDO8105740.1 hypothetical protein [Isoptericola sp. b441]MDO8122445.1 hypothetical protein [Isoptericola sp. b490]
MGMVMTEYSPDEPMDARDRTLLARLGRVVRTVDPVPDGLADRALFAITLDGLESELVELVRLQTPEPALRGEETVTARTVTFTADPCTVMITLSPGAGGIRVDGWIAPAVRCDVALFRPDGEIRTESDDEGCFVLEDVPTGPASLVLRRSDGTGPAVSTPVIEL